MKAYLKALIAKAKQVLQAAAAAKAEICDAHKEDMAKADKVEDFIRAELKDMVRQFRARAAARLCPEQVKHEAKMAKMEDEIGRLRLQQKRLQEETARLKRERFSYEAQASRYRCQAAMLHMARFNRPMAAGYAPDPKRKDKRS